MNRSMTMLFVPMALLAMILMASCAEETDENQVEEGAPVSETTQADPFDVVATDPGAVAPVPQQESYFDRSEEAGVEAQWPSGCPKRAYRTRESIRRPGEPAVTEISCDRFDDSDRGCKITVYHELTDGQSPMPGDVTKTISEIIGNLNLEIWKQRAIGRDGREGVAAYCREINGSRHVWIEGFIVGEEVLLVMAWDHDVGLYNDVEIGAFFSSIHMIP